MASADRLEQRLGYRFTSGDLLAQALTHRSYGARHNERLEFLGDGVLGCVIAAALCERFPEVTEGQLTRLRASLVREEALASVAGELKLADFMNLGEVEAGSPSGVRPSILADALEALFGAIFLDGGYESARVAIVTAYAPLLAQLDPAESIKDAKTRLQELLQARKLHLPRYRVARLSGAPHEQEFEVECAIEELKLSSTGSGTSRQRSEERRVGKECRL